MMIPSLNYVVFTHALHALHNGNMHYCESLGFTYEEIKSLSSLSLDALFFISNTSAALLTVTIHHDRLDQSLKQSCQESQRQQQIDRAIRLGGSIALLNTYFGLTSNETCQRRRLTGVTVPHGRAPLPDETTDTRLWHLWQQYSPGSIHSLNALDVMMQITEELSRENTLPVSLTTVWNRIAHCEQERQNRRMSRAG